MKIDGMGPIMPNIIHKSWYLTCF